LTDYYSISLNILHRLLKDTGEEHWANWIQKDIHLWRTEKKVEHHLSAYGGMGSINDLSVDGLDTIGIWKNNLFEMTKTLSWSLAKGKIAAPPLDEHFYRYGTNHIGGWQCINCGHARISSTNIELYVAADFLPRLFVRYLKQDNLMELLHLEKLVALEEIVNARSAVEQLIQSEKITLTTENGWLQTCPNCKSDNIGGYRWQIANDYTKLITAKDNLS